MNPYEVVSRQISSQLNIKEAELNNSTMIEINGKMCVLQKETDDDWLEFSLLVIQLSGQGNVKKVPIQFHRLLASQSKHQPARTAQVRVRSNMANAANDLKIDLVNNPKNPNNWFLLLRSKLERRLFVHQFIDAEKQIKFFEYSLRSRAVKSVKWCPLSEAHLMILYKSELEIVNFEEQLFAAETYIDIGRLYSESQEGDIPQLVDIAMLNSPNHLFQAYILAVDGTIIHISPILLGKFTIPEQSLMAMLQNVHKMGDMQNFISRLMNHEKTVVKKYPLTNSLLFTVDVKLAKNYTKLTIIDVINRKDSAKFSNMYMLQGIAFPVILACHAYQGENAGKMSFFMINGKEALEAYLMEFNMTLPLKLAVAALNTMPKVIYQEGIQSVLVLFFNKIYKIDFTALENMLKSENALISANRPRVTVWLESEIHVNKEIDKFDMGYYGTYIDQNKICTIRLYNNEIAAFQLSPILKITKVPIRESLETILKTMKSPMQLVQVKQQQPVPSIQPLKQQKNKDRIKQKFKNILYQSQVLVNQNVQSFNKMVSQLGQYNSQCKLYKQRVDEIKDLMNRVVNNKNKIKEWQKNTKATGESVLTELTSDYNSYEAILNSLPPQERHYAIEEKLRKIILILKNMKEKLIQLKISKKSE